MRPDDGVPLEEIDRQIGSRIVLTGHVSTWLASSEAQKAVLALPGVTQVQNEITVGT